MPAKKSPQSNQKKTGVSKHSRTASKIRKEIDSVDQELLSAIELRAQLWAELQAAEPNSDVVPDHNNSITAAFQSAKDQATIDRLFRELDGFCASQVKTRSIAYLGPIYTYSYLAAAQHFGQSHEMVSVATISAVFEKVSSGESDYGVVPIENSTDGRIADTLTMFSKHEVAIFREIHLPIQHCLIGTGNLNQIKEIRSKSQALSQCRNWLDGTFTAKVDRVPTSSSSDAAHDAKRLGEHVAAIASREAAMGLGLKVIASNIEDHQGNLTRFAIIVDPNNKQVTLPPKTGRDKTSIMFAIPHRPGALADVINVFKRSKLNLTWIESFPKPGVFSEYTFFAEFQGHRNEVKVRNAIDNLEKKTEELTILGSYPEFDPAKVERH